MPHAHMSSGPNLPPLHAALFPDSCSEKMTAEPPCSPQEQRSIQKPRGWSKFSPLGCAARGFGPFPASSGGRWTGSCPEISAHLVRRSRPPVKRGHSSALSPIRTVYRATGARSGWRRRWLHILHTHLSVSGSDGTHRHLNTSDFLRLVTCWEGAGFGVNL